MTSGPERASPTLLAFPYAGGHALSFRPLATALPSSWRLAVVDPPGHGWTPGPAIERIEEMVERYLPALEPWFAGRFLLYGHSLGGLVAWHIAARLEGTTRAPAALVIAAMRGPRRVLDDLTWSSRTDDELADRIDSIGGLPEVFRAHREDFMAFLPPIRADFRALERYAHVPRPPIAIPTRVLAGRDDPFVLPERCREWVEHATPAHFRLVPGGHFFLESHPGEVAREIVEAERAT